MSIKNDTEKAAELKETIRLQMEFNKPIAIGYSSPSMDDYLDKRISPSQEFYDQNNDPAYIKWLEEKSK